MQTTRRGALVRITAGAIALAGLASASAVRAAGNDGIYLALGAAPGVSALVDDLVARLLADPRMNPFFRDVDLAHFRQRLAAQICEVAGGPCRYDGKDMKQAHAGVDITRSDFNALVELLQDTMAARGIPFGVQNRLLARLAPMHRTIVNAP